MLLLKYLLVVCDYIILGRIFPELTFMFLCLVQVSPPSTSLITCNKMIKCVERTLSCGDFKKLSNLEQKNDDLLGLVLPPSTAGPGYVVKNWTVLTWTIRIPSHLLIKDDHSTCCVIILIKQIWDDAPKASPGNKVSTPVLFLKALFTFLSDYRKGAEHQELY